MLATEGKGLPMNGYSTKEARARLERHGVSIIETFYIGVEPWFLIEDENEEAGQISVKATNRAAGTYLRRIAG
jgi:hypothetical protein